MFRRRREGRDLFPSEGSEQANRMKLNSLLNELRNGDSANGGDVRGYRANRRRLTSPDVIRKQFDSASRREPNYSAEKVDAFLDEVAWTIGDYERELGELRRRLGLCPED